VNRAAENRESLLAMARARAKAEEVEEARRLIRERMEEIRKGRDHRRTRGADKEGSRYGKGRITIWSDRRSG